MKPIVPTHIVGGSVLIEATPIARGLARVYRGVDLGDADGALHPRTVPSAMPAGGGPSAPSASSASSTLYRDPPDEGALPSLTPVIVRVMSHEDEVVGHADLFRRMTMARRRMAGSPAPRLLSTLGLEGHLAASVEQYVYGTSLVEVMSVLRANGARMPVPIALAIGRGLLPLWMTAVPDEIRVSVDLGSVLIDTRGTIRVLPTYRDEQSRHVVGAALFSLHELVAMSSPEELMGEEPDGRSAMFYLGLVLYEMIAGAHPVDSKNRKLFETLTEIAQRDVPHLWTHRRDVHPTVTELVHRCLARDPAGRLADWTILLAAYAGVQALFPPTGRAEILEYLRGILPRHSHRAPPRVVLPSAWQTLPRLGYVPMQPIVPNDTALPLPPDGARAPRPSRSPSIPSRPVLDANAVYPRPDARPMYPVTTELLVDARPVTRAEIERYFFAIRSEMPPHLGALETSSDDDPCVLVSAEVASAYATWTGKRIPTEDEWSMAVAIVGPARLGMGEIWEWTSSPHGAGGYVVRGGRWRDQLDVLAQTQNRSFATSPAPDLGFRCVADTYSLDSSAR